MIPDDQVDEVRARADIVEVIGEFVSLKKSGKDFKARCPFHEEKTPSFYVVPDKGIYKCFGCGEAGDVFGFLMKQAGMDFVDAVRHVASRSGVELREVSGRGPAEDPHRGLREALAFARDFFRKALLDPDGGAHARDYLASRGVDEETGERFGIGYAPDEWHALGEAAARHGLEEEVLLGAGLLARSERSQGPYDAFRNRVVFPIEDVGGRTVAFGARLLGRGEGGPKYLNSPESPVYHKGETCYGLSWAKHAIRREGAVLLVEGYMDVVTLAASGVEHVVAPLGTSLTVEQARLLARYSKRVLLLFDSDAAGLKATFRAGDVLLAEGHHPAVVTLPPGEDPDTLVRKEGAAGLGHYLEEAVDVMDRKLQMLQEHGYFQGIEGTRQALDKLLPTLRAAADPALRDIYVSRVAERTGVRRETLEGELLKRRGGPPSPGRVPRTPALRPLRSPLPALGAERNLLLLMSRSPDYVERTLEWISPQDFEDTAYRAIFEALLADPALRAPPPAMDPVAARRREEILADPEELGHAARVFQESVNRLRQQILSREGDLLERRLEATTDPAERERLNQEKIRLSRERQELGSPWSHAGRKLRTLGKDP